MDPENAELPTPTAGSPEVRNIVSDPLGIAEPATREKYSDITFEEASEDNEHGRYNHKSGQFESSITGAGLFRRKASGLGRSSLRRSVPLTTRD
jgi:hypothetical protein